MDTKSKIAIIDNIHFDFKNEAAVLMKQTEDRLKDLGDVISKIDKKKKLLKAGFLNAKDAQGLIKEEAEVNAKLILKEAISHFAIAYPINKFITEESIIQLCEKWDLYQGYAKQYNSDIPDKNLDEITNFKAGEECLNSNGEKFPFIICATSDKFNTKGFEEHVYYQQTSSFQVLKSWNPDPIVLQPVKFKGIMYYLIVTAWGQESVDVNFNQN